MSESTFELKGVARAIPDVCTFVTPIFGNREGGYFIQEVTNGRVVGFQRVTIAEEFDPLRYSLSVTIGDEALCAFEVSSGSYLLGTGAHLAQKLAQLRTSGRPEWGAEDPTIGAIDRFIKAVPPFESTHPLLVALLSVKTSIGPKRTASRELTDIAPGKPPALAAPVAPGNAPPILSRWDPSRSADMRFSCDRFAAFLAHLLNDEDARVAGINSGMLYVMGTEALAGRYAQTLLQYSTYASRMSPEEAAARYWEAILSRRLESTQRVELSVTHRLFVALCKRGSEDGWEAATLRRERLGSRGGLRHTPAHRLQPAHNAWPQYRMNSLPPRRPSRRAAGCSCCVRMVNAS